MILRSLARRLACMAWCLTAIPAHAQLRPRFPGGAPDSAAPTVSVASPQAAVVDFLRQADAGHWSGAADYLVIPPGERERAPELARRLKAVIDQRLVLDVTTLSPAIQGDTTDGDRAGDRIGVIRSPAGREEVLRVVRLGTSPTRWLFSEATVGNIDAWYESLRTPWVTRRVPPVLQAEGPLNLFWWQWIGVMLALPILALLAWLAGAILRRLVSRVVARTMTDWDDLLLLNLSGPFRLGAAALLTGPVLAPLALNVRVSAAVTSAARGLAFLSVFWVLVRVIRIVQLRLEQAVWEAGQGAEARTLVPLLGNFLRVAVGIVALLVALAQFGYPVGTLLAGLGIGGIAVALAAQKTVEHLFGSVSLAADKAFRVGDWVRAGGTEGTVERIGLRSTSIRTIDRTVVRVPNGRLADERIETFGERDRILLKTFLDVTYDTTPAQLEAIRTSIDATLRAHPKVWPDVIRVHVTDLTESAIRFEIVAWFQTTEWVEFLGIRHALFLRFLEVIQEHGSSLAFPSRTVYHVTSDGGPVPPGVT
jgi:MscS family membrane protein